ncbi:MAG: dipeptidase [Planctomycetaceae bacterium]|nr:dipeptidase [Planctomycetaceae bacterium]
MTEIAQYVADHADDYVADLTALLKIPSISADSNHKGDMTKAAEWLKARFEAAGLSSEIVPTAGHPIVTAEWCEAEGAPTVMIYGHYDVQPPDPLDLWTTPPFEPDIRDGKIYARGATDDKGQMITHLFGVEAWLKTEGKLPVNVKFIIEGEEEVGSDNLDKYLEEHKETINCDVAVVSDTSQYAPGMPAITYGLRGITACEVTLRGPSKDLHSGMFGGTVANPLTGMSQLLSRLHDLEGRVQVPGFYEDVLELSPEEREEFASLPFNEQEFCEELGVESTFGEAGFTTIERRWARPTCELNGIFGGYSGEGPKTIVPSFCTAKISCRLVPNQNAEKILSQLEVFLRENLPAGLMMEFKTYHGCPAALVDRNSPYLAAARQAISTAFGTEPVLIREGGSIPVVGAFREILGIDTLLLGWGQDTDNLHSPDEHFDLGDFQRGIAASAELWKTLSGI